MEITHGLLNGQVLQRNAEGWASARITGTSAAAGDVEIRVLAGETVLPGHDWAVAGVADGSAWKASLDELPSGGPYEVELQVKTDGGATEKLCVGDIFVGDVWILGGQSNMEGIGNIRHAPAPHPMVRAFYMRDEWAVAEEKLHFLGEAVDKVHNSYGNEPGRPPAEELAKGRAALVKGVGPGHAFGLEMQARTGVPQGLIPCAHGGTSMAQWSPSLRDQGGDSLYGATMRRYEKLGQRVAGVIWYQGESDANEEAAALYTDKMIELVAATRRDLHLADLPWVIVQLGCHIAPGGKYWNSIQEQQRCLPEVIDNLDVAAAVDLGLDDGIHIGGEDQMVLGARLARLADNLVHHNPDAKAGISLEKIELIPTPDTNKDCPAMAVVITYGNVVGELVSQGRPYGFALVNSRGEEFPGIYKTTLAGNTVTLHTGLPAVQLETLGVSYGYGRYPYCNITDSDGMSIPAMQSVLIKSDHARPCRDWETVRLPDAATIADVSPAMADAATGWQAAPPRDGFGFLPKPIEDREVGVFVMRTTLMASADLDALLIFGANSPFKIWLNGELIDEDPAATMPLNPDQYKLNIKLTQGENSLRVAFAPIGPGAHLGISARVGTPAGTREPRVAI